MNCTLTDRDDCVLRTWLIIFVDDMSFQGCRSPLVVKFADTQKEKEMKKLQQMQSNLLNAANVAGLGMLGPQYLSVSSYCVDLGPGILWWYDALWSTDIFW